MAKKIVQYCYFGEDAMEAGYIKYTDPNLESSFQSLVAEKALYCFDELTQTYLLLDTTDTYDSKKEYYVVAPKSRINYPTTITKASLISGSIFNNITPIVKLGIQAIPGTRFRVNSNKDWIVIGMTGIYELDLSTSSATIIKLQFDETSLDIIDQNENAYLIIDIMSEIGGE